MNRRVVVTGVGLVSPLGCSTKTLWQSLLSCKSGITYIDYFDVSEYPAKIAGVLPKDEYTPDLYMTQSEQRRVDQFIVYAVVAAAQAYDDAGFAFLDEEQRAKTVVTVGSGIGGVKNLYTTSVTLHNDGPRRVSPFFIPSVLINLASGHIAIKYGLTGLNYGVVSACASGTHSIGEAYEMIKLGRADFAIAGGAEYAVCELGISGFGAAKALSTRYNNDPTSASRPWDVDRDGFVVGEGAGVLCMETYESAVSRGAKIYGEIVGYGASCDAYHITAPLVSGKGAAAAMQNALNDAKLAPEDVDYTNAHGTSTMPGDIAEVVAIKKVFGKHAYKVNVSSTKSAMGHLLGAAGAVESIVCLLAMQNSVCPATLNLHKPSPECDINLTPLVPQERRINVAMNNSFGFGGTNACLIFKKL